MREAITTSQLPERPAPLVRERVRITTAEIDLGHAPRKPGVKGFVDTIKTSDLGEDRKLKAQPADPEKKAGRQKKG